MRITGLPLIAFCCGTAAAQTTGTEHWLAYMENLNLAFNGPPSFAVVVSGEEATTGSITFPATGFSLPFTVNAGSATVVTLPLNTYYPEGDEDIVNKGMRITSEAPVAVYAYHDRAYFSEATQVLPYDLLSANYTLIAHEDDLGSDPSEFVVLATADSTVVEITPSILTAGFRPPGQPFTVVLNIGEVFQVQAIGDLSGTRVRSLDENKPIAVFSGARQANVGCAASADDHLYNQALPETLWGTEHIAVPFKDRGGDEFRILAGTDGTQITIGNQPPVTLNAGATFNVTLSQVTVITATAPITVGQFNESQDCNPNPGDPCFVWNLPAAFEDHRFIWNARTGAGTPAHFVNVLVEGSAGAPPVFLDGVNIAPQFQPVPGVVGTFYAQLAITEGQHDLQSAALLWAVAYGFGDYNSYAFSLGYEEDLSTGSIDMEPATRPAMTPVVTQGETWPMALRGSGRAVLTLFDPAGRLLFRGPVTGTTPTDLLDGLYLYRLEEGGTVQQGRLVVR